MDNPIDEDDICALTDAEILSVSGGLSSVSEVIDGIGKALAVAARGGDAGGDSSWTFLPW
jgi:hypothetical protein